MDFRNVLDAVVKVIGFVLTVALAGGVTYVIYRALSRLLVRLVGDETIAQAGTTLAVLLLGLRGIEAALSYITQPDLRYLHTGLTGLLDGMADVIQWIVLIAALLFIGYALRGWRGPQEED